MTPPAAPICQKSLCFSDLRLLRNAHLAYASECFKEDPIACLRWLDESLQKQPPRYLYSGRLDAVEFVLYLWPKDDLDITEAESWLFKIYDGVVNYPAVYHYLEYLPPERRIALADKWLNDPSIAVHTRDDLCIAFGAALEDGRPTRAKEIFASIQNDTIRKACLVGDWIYGSRLFGLKSIGGRRFPHGCPEDETR